MNLQTFFWAAFLSFLPISELRGGLPFALLNGMSWPLAYFYCVTCNALVAPLCWIFLSTFHKLFLRMKWYEKFFNRFVERARAKVHGGVERFGLWGIALFVAIPLPITGAWTGTLGAWILGLEKRKTLIAVIAGVLVSGLIVSAVVTLGISALDIFVKDMSH